MKKIAIDIDGVILDSENLYRVYAEIYDVDILKADNLYNNTPRTVEDRYNWNKEQLDRFNELHKAQALSKSNIITGADIVIKKLKEEFELIIVTARDEYELSFIKKEIELLGFDNDKIFINQKDKTNILIEEKCDYIIDDDINNCIAASKKGIISIYFKNAAAEKIEDSVNFKAVNNWGEIYKYLKLNNK